MSANRPYHHGDLPAALIQAALELARDGGSSAVSIRAVTREAGVSPAAVYRHFPDYEALLRATVRHTRQALTEAMRAAQAEQAETTDAAASAVRRLRGVGLGYIRFALDEPGWFELAFNTPAAADDPDSGPEPGPFDLLIEALDEMRTTGVLDGRRRQNAEWVCWGSVHGFADLVARGPLRDQPDETIAVLATQVVDTVIAGVIAGASAADVTAAPR